MHRKIYFIILSVFFLFTWNGCEKKNECVKNIPDWCNYVDLSDEYDPVCGCDGVTYRNSACAECIGGVTSYTKGECE